MNWSNSSNSARSKTKIGKTRMVAQRSILLFNIVSMVKLWKTDRVGLQPIKCRFIFSGRITGWKTLCANIPLMVEKLGTVWLFFNIHVWPSGLIDNQKRSWIKAAKLQLNTFVTELRLFIEDFLLWNSVVAKSQQMICQINCKNISMDDTPLVLLVILIAPTVVFTEKTCVSYRMKRNIGYDPGSCEMVDLDSTARGVDCVDRCNKTSTVRVQKYNNWHPKTLFLDIFCIETITDITFSPQKLHEKDFLAEEVQWTCVPWIHQWWWGHDRKQFFTFRRSVWNLGTKFPLILCIIFWNFLQSIGFAIPPTLRLLINPSCADGDYSLSLVPANTTTLFMLQQISYTGDYNTHLTSRLCVTLEQSKSLSVATTAIKLVGLTAKCYLI